MEENGIAGEAGKDDNGDEDGDVGEGIDEGDGIGRSDIFNGNGLAGTSRGII